MTDGPINGETFLFYIEKIRPDPLAGRCRQPGPTSAATKARRLAPSSEPKAPTSSSCRPKSQDLNPTEQVFAKLKHPVRKAQPRDLEATSRKVGQILDLFSQAKRANYLVNSGYGSV